MQKVIITAYAAWQRIPAGVRAGISLFVMGLVTAGMTFGWHFPTDWTDAKAEVALFWAFIVPIGYGLFQKTIWPPVLAWVLGQIGLVQFTVGIAGTNKTSAWIEKVA